MPVLRSSGALTKISFLQTKKKGVGVALRDC